eukprot:1417539-Rhodomonas_salina.1
MLRHAVQRLAVAEPAVHGLTFAEQAVHGLHDVRHVRRVVVRVIRVPDLDRPQKVDKLHLKHPRKSTKLCKNLAESPQRLLKVGGEKDAGFKEDEERDSRCEGEEEGEEGEKCGGGAMHREEEEGEKGRRRIAVRAQCPKT